MHNLNNRSLIKLNYPEKKKLEYSALIDTLLILVQKINNVNKLPTSISRQQIWTPFISQDGCKLAWKIHKVHKIEKVLAY